MMENRFRLYGKAPYKVVLVHGGPAAWGEMAPVAKHLSSLCGIFEPFQTCPTLDGQIYELRDLIESKVEFPAILIGHSWGAWLSFLFTARFPTLVNKLILVGSGPFQQNYAENINFTRLGLNRMALFFEPNVFRNSLFYVM